MVALTSEAIHLESPSLGLRAVWVKWCDWWLMSLSDFFLALLDRPQYWMGFSQLYPTKLALILVSSSSPFSHWIYLLTFCLDCRATWHKHIVSLLTQIMLDQEHRDKIINIRGHKVLMWFNQSYLRSRMRKNHSIIQ